MCKCVPLSWTDELAINTLLPLHCAFHVTHAWPNSKYEDTSEILYHPSIPGGGAEKVWGGRGGLHPSQLPSPPSNGHCLVL